VQTQRSSSRQKKQQSTQNSVSFVRHGSEGRWVVPCPICLHFRTGRAALTFLALTVRMGCPYDHICQNILKAMRGNQSSKNSSIFRNFLANYGEIKVVDAGMREGSDGEHYHRPLHNPHTSNTCHRLGKSARIFVRNETTLCCVKNFLKYRQS